MEQSQPDQRANARNDESPWILIAQCEKLFRQTSEATGTHCMIEKRLHLSYSLVIPIPVTGSMSRLKFALGKAFLMEGKAYDSHLPSIMALVTRPKDVTESQGD